MKMPEIPSIPEMSPIFKDSEDGNNQWQKMDVPDSLSTTVDNAWINPSSNSTQIENTVAHDGQTLNLRRDGINGYGGSGDHFYQNVVGSANSVINFI